MKKYLLSLFIVFGLVLVSNISKGQVVIDNITNSVLSGPPFTFTASGAVPPCGAATGTLGVSMVTNTLPAGTVFTFKVQTSSGIAQTNVQTTTSAGQLITQNYSGLAGSVTGIAYSIIITTPKIPPAPNDSTYFTVINLHVFTTKNFLASVTPINPLCPVPPNKGSASVNVSSGTAPYTYTWSVAPNPNPGNSANAPNLDAGSYSVYVTDVNGCDTTMPFTLVVQKPTVSLSSNPGAPICGPSFPLNITWTATPGAGWTPNPGGAYSWDGGVTFIASNTQTQAGILTYGTYSKTVIFKDINNCLSVPVTLAVPVDNKPAVTAVATPSSVCPGTTSSIMATLVPPCSSIGATCSFSFDNGATYSAVNPYTTPAINQDTTFMVRVMNSTGCVSNPFPVLIDTSGKPKLVSVVSPSPICPNAAYSITSTCANNCTGIQINFNNNGFIAGSPQTFNQPTAPLVASTTTFPISAKGANGCQFDTTVTVTVFPNTLTITGPATPICANNNGSTVTLTASGFKPATTVTWSSTPPGLPGDGATTTSIVVSSPASGSISYMITGTDVNNCPRTANFNITVNPQPTVTASGPAFYCQGAPAITLSGSGASTYKWFDGTFTSVLSPSGSTFNVTPSATTTYGVVGTDASGCKDSSTITVTFHTRPTGTASASPSTICAGNTSDITITATSLPFTPNASGGYSVTDGITYSGTSASPFTFAGVGPFASTATINTKLRDNFGCESVSIPVTITVLPFTAAISGASALCSTSSNGTATLTVSGGTPNYKYSVDLVGGPYTSFAGASTLISGLSAGVTHTIFVQDVASACNTSVNVTVTTPPVLSLTMTSVTNVQCKGQSNGSITVNVTGGTAVYDLYLNTIGAATFTNVASGSHTYTGLAGGVAGALTYDLIVEDANGCRDTVVDVPVNEPATALAAPSITPPSFCFGTSTGVFTMSPAATGGWGTYSYTFNGTAIALNGTRNGLAAGTYPLMVTDLNGCQASTTVTLTSSPELFSNASTIQSNCGSNGSILFAAATGGTSPYQYSLDDVTYSASLPANMAPVSVNTTATLYAMDAQGCKDDTTVTVLNIPRAIPNITIVPPTCPGGNDGSITVDSVTIKMAGGEPYSFDLFTDKSPKVSVGTGGPVNANVSIPFAAMSKGSYILEMSDAAGSGCNNYVVDSFRVYTGPATYIVVKTASTQNPGYAKIVVTEPAGIVTSSIALASDINQSTGTAYLYNITGGTPITMGSKNGYQMSIDNPLALVNTKLKDTLNGQTYVAYRNLAPGPHSVYIRDANGCSDTIQVEVPGKFFIPNLISPNKDDHNDYFEVVSLPDNSQLRIFNRWGERVFQADNYDNKYDFVGLSDGIYYYDLEFDTGTRFKGWVQVIR
jgi:gliding motility-associated-like protein